MAEGGPDTMFKWFYNGTQSQCLDCSVIQTNTTTDIDGNTMHVSKYFDYSVWFLMSHFCILYRDH